VKKSSKQPNVFRDFISLTKPRINLLSLLMGCGGIALAPGSVPASTWLWALLGIGLAVGSANILNMVLERRTDALMARTAMRPIPAGRVSADSAIIFAAILGAASQAVLIIQVNPITALLGAFALMTYAFVYTPLKRRTPAALLVGTLPGAAPPLMGWTAATGKIDAPGLVLFGILVVWQIPHFLAIAVYSAPEYKNAGIQVVPLVRGERVAIIQTILWSIVLIPMSLLLIPLDIATWLYGITALAGGFWLLWLSVLGLGSDDKDAWARRFFRATLIYLPSLTAVLIVDQLWM